MNKMKLAISGLLVLMVVAINGMNREERIHVSCDSYYHDLRRAITQGYDWTFMETLNRMEAEGHALDGNDYDALKAYAQEKEFDRFGILENTVYQKLSAPVLRDDAPQFASSYIDMMYAGRALTDDQLYWLLDLARRKGSSTMAIILTQELQRRGIQTG